MKEVWKPIPSLPGYEASSLGQIRRLDYEFIRIWGGKRQVVPRKGRILKQAKPNKWTAYPKVMLPTQPKTRSVFVHRLIAEAFHKPVPGRNHVNHKDGNKLNNQANNLEWVNQKENMQHASKNGLIMQGIDHCFATLTAQQIREIRQLVSQKKTRRGHPLIKDIAKKYKVSTSAIGRIGHKKAYKFV